MLETLVSASEQASAWISALAKAIKDHDERALSGVFQVDSHWRNLGGISWPIRTFSGPEKIAHELCRRAAEVQAANFAIDFDLLPPRDNVIAEKRVIEAIVRFDTINGPGLGVVRLIASHSRAMTPKAWTLSTGLDIDRICLAREAQRAPESHSRNFAEPSWSEQRRAKTAYSDHEPEILVVGGGHAGVTAAVELKRLGCDVLVIDRTQRVGDNWRLRYNGLRLHNTWHSNHFRYMPFPVTLPAYLPKDKVANWIEAYVDTMDVNFWTDTVFEKAAYDEKCGSWTATVRRGDGTARVLRPKHIVMATSVSGTPNIPNVPTLENFQGPVLHSSSFTGGAEWKDRSALVIGTGTSAHDIAQELHARGAKVTMVQRSPTLVVNIEPSAQLYDGIYLGEGPPLEVRDLLASSMPYPVTKLVHKAITQKVKELDAPLLDRLRKVGFKLDFGEDETGWPLKFRTRGGGYYFNVGCSDLIADGSVGLIQAADIKNFSADGVQLTDGSALKADLIVLGTGFKGHDEIVRTHFGQQVLDRVGPIWGLDPESHELRNMWMRTPQPGLWFTGGAFSMSRMYSRVLALQIDAIEQGRLTK
jgi:cation diffusion facilitator CzcD-associated flavoprotein CzcO